MPSKAPSVKYQPSSLAASNTGDNSSCSQCQQPAAMAICLLGAAKLVKLPMHCLLLFQPSA
jgi:hypothetical protein